MACIGNVQRWESSSSTETGKTTSFSKGARQRRCVFSRIVTHRRQTQNATKAVGVGSPIDKRATLRGFTSSDGVRWQVLDQDPILIAPDDPWPMFDSHNVAFWDTLQSRYVAYMRGWIPPGVRAIRRSVSDDFRHWSEPEFIDLGNSPTEHLYKNACTQYFRAPHIYLMFPKRFRPRPQVPSGLGSQRSLRKRVYDQSRWCALGSAFHGAVSMSRFRSRQLDRPKYVHRCGCCSNRPN